MKLKNLIVFMIFGLSLIYCANENDIIGYIENGNTEELKKLLAKDFDPADTINGRTYFQYAVSDGQLEVLKQFMVHSGSKLEEYKLKDLLFLSVKEEQSEIYEYLSKEVDLSSDQTSISHLISLLNEVQWDKHVGSLILTNKDVNIFYDFVEKNRENEKFDSVMHALFKRQLPINEVYIGSKYDGYTEEEEYYDGEEYDDYEEPQEEYEYGSFSSLMSKIGEKKNTFLVDYISTNTETRKGLLTFSENENKLFNNFYKKIFEDNSFDDFYDNEDIKRRYTGTITKRLPFYLPKFSRFNHEYYIDEEMLGKMHNSNKQYYAYLFHRLDRNSFILKWIWNAWKETIFSNISTKTYFKKTFYDYTEALIKTYDTITSRDNYAEALEEAYHKLATANCEYIDECFSESIRYSEEGWRVDWTWTSGFWARRFHEENQEVVYKILKEISAHYAGNELKKLIQKRLDKEITETSHLSVIKRLVAEGAEANLLVGKHGISELHVAVLKNNHSEIKKLLKNGVEINSRDKNKLTPLYYSMNVKTASLLAKNGALINDSINKTKPVKYFRDRKENDTADFLENYKK